MHADFGSSIRPLKPSIEVIDRNIVLSGVLAALILGTVLRWLINADESLWYDEVWTGTIAAQDWRGAIEILGIDVNAPLYYLAVWGWAKVFGLSDTALRTPGVLATVTAPFAAWFLLRGRASLNERAVFTIIIALWIPGLYYATEARSYAFTVLGAVLQTVFFYRALQSEGSRGDIASWALSGLFLGLTHYTTMVLSAVQGIAFLALFWRTRLLAVVLAGLAYIPVFAIFWAHREGFSRISNFEYFWLKPLVLHDLGRSLKFLTGETYVLASLVGIVGVAFVVDGIKAGNGVPKHAGIGIMSIKIARLWSLRLRDAFQSPLFMTAAVSVIGLALFLGIAVFRPVFLPRYLIPFAPGFFLGLVWIVGAMPTARRWASYATAAVFFSAASVWSIQSATSIHKVLTWEHESALLRNAGVSDVRFFLDQGYPTPYPEFLHSKVFSFFFARDGADVGVREFVPDYQEFTDPRPELVRFLSEKPGRGLIWTLYPGPSPDPLPADADGKIERIRTRGFSAVFDPTSLENVKGVRCQATSTAWYRKYVCYSAF